MTGEKLSSILVADMELIYGLVRSSSRRGGYDVKGLDGGIVILSRCEFNFFGEH